jgi:hypothetical protein
MKRLKLVLLVFLTFAGMVLRAEEGGQSFEEIDRMFGGYFTDPDWERKFGGLQADEQNFPRPSENQVNVVQRMAEIRQQYWDAYKKGGSDFEAAKLQFATVLFYRDVYRMLTDIQGNEVPDWFRSKSDLDANRGGELLWQLWGKVMTLSSASGEPIRESAKSYFDDWSRFFHSELTRAPHTFPGIPNLGAVSEIWQRAQASYLYYKVARDWAEEAAAPFPLPIEVYVFGLVRRWPVPAKEEQAVRDYEAFLKLFGVDQVFEAAKKVQAAMNKEGQIENPEALGVRQEFAESADIAAQRKGIASLAPGDPRKENWEKQLARSLETEKNATYFFSHNPYWVLWALLPKNDPKIVRLYQNYLSEARKYGFGSDSSYLRADIFALQPMMDSLNIVAKSPPESHANTPSGKLTRQPESTSGGVPTPVPLKENGSRTAATPGLMTKAEPSETAVPTPVPTIKVKPEPTPTPDIKPDPVPEPTPQPAPAPLPMKLEMPTPTPAPKAPKSRWDTQPEATEEQVAEQDLRNAESEFFNAWSPFLDQERALLKPEEDGWTAYFDSVQDPVVKAKGLRERAKYLGECYAYLKYYERYKAYRAWCKSNGKPVPPPLVEESAAPVVTPTPVSADLVEQEKAAEQEYRALWNPLTDKQRIALLKEESDFELAFRKLRDHGSPGDRIKAYKEEIVRMKSLIKGITVQTDPGTVEKLKQKLAELDVDWNSLPPEQLQRVQPNKEAWLAAIASMGPSDQLRETEARIKFLKDNLGQFMRTSGTPAPAEDRSW